MGLFDKIKEFVAGEEESPVTAASVLAKVREKYPHLRGIDDLSLSQSLYKKDPAKFSYLKTYAPDTTVPPALVPKSMRDDAFYKANPQEGTKDALKVIEQVKAKFPKYKSVDAKKLAVALETKNPTMFAGLSKKLMPGQTAIPKGETEAATIPLIPSGTMGATKPVSPVQVTPPVRPIETKPEPKVRPSVTSISPEEAKLPDGTKPLKFKNGIEAYLAVEKLAKPTLVEYPGRHGQTIRRIMTTEIPSFPPPPEDKGKDLVGKIVGKEEAFARGVGVSGAQVPELAYGATALVADSAEKLFGSGTASRVKDWALRGYQRASKVSEEVHGDEVKSVVESWKEAKKGNLDALGDWLSYWSGYAAGQLGESAAVAFLGGLVGSVVPGPGTAAGAVAGVTAKTATKGVIRGALERLVERQALKLTAEGVAASEAKKLAVKQIATAIGAASAIGAYAVVQEGGSIYPDAVKKAEEDGRKLNGYDLGRVWGTILVAAGADGLGDMLGLGFLTGKVRIPGRLGKVARIVGTAVSGGLAGGGTESIQTAVERVGAGRKPFDQEGIQAIIESAAAGAIPGLGAGGVGATISGQPRANVQSLAATQEASPELLSYLDRVEKINRARLEMPEKLDLTPERPQMQPFVPAPPIPRSTAPVNEIVKTHAKSIMNEAVSEYNLERDRFSRWRDLIGPGLRPPRVLPGNRDVMGEYNTLPVWQKSGKGRFADEVAEEAVSVGLISKPEDIYDALRSLKAPSNPSRNVEDYYDEAQRFVDAEQPDTQPERKYPETEMPNFSASKKEDVTKGPARAEFIGYQEGLPEDTPIPLYNVMGESPRALSTVGSEELKSLGIETPKTPSFEEWKAGGDVTEGQVSAKKLIEKLASANEISDAVAVEFVKHITPTGENFYKSYGEEFSPEKFRVLGATIPQYTQNGLNFAIKLAQGAKESTGAHEMFHAMKQMGFFSQDEMRVLEGRFGNEEKIADALGEYATRRTGAEAQSRIKAIFDRFLDFVKRVGSMLVGRGWTRAEDIFESVVKGRPEKIGNQKSGHPMFKAEPKDRTQTPEFKRWFGDSKVVDADGKPLVVYHGSIDKNLTQFNLEKAVEVEGGFFFTSNSDVAHQYTFERAYGDIIGEKPLGRVVEAYLSLQNPLVWQTKPGQKTVDAVEMGRAIEEAKAKGHDGLIVQNIDDSIGMTGDMGDTYVAFKPTQIKSATGNSGTFDPNNPSILYQAERIPPTPEKISDAVAQTTTITPPKNESEETPGSPYFAAPRSNAHRRVPPPVLEALQSAEGKLNDLTVGQAGELSTLAPTRAMEVMDGKRFGLMKEHFLKPIQDADKSFQIELKSMRAEAKAVLHGLTADERRSVYNAIDLKHQIHSDKVKRAVDFLRKTYDDLLDRINTARAAAGKDPVQKRQNYITHYQELSVLNDILDMIGLNMTEVPNSMLTISMFTKPNSPYFQFAKRRLGEQTERDAEQAFLRYLEPALRTIHFSPATKNARDIIEYKVKIPSEYEGGKIDTVSLFGIRYPNAYRYLTNYLNVVSGKRPILDKIFPQGAAIAGVMNKLFAAGSIGGNISTVITQAASLRNTIAETGLFAFKGQMLINTPKGYRFFKKNSRIGLGRQYEPSTKGTRLLGSKALAKTHEAVSDLISIPVGLFDREMVGGAFLAGYFKGRSIGLSEADAIRYGDDVAERTQASANIVDRPPINTGKLKTALGQFQTFVYNEWSQIRNDMVKKAVLGENSKQGYGDGLSGIREGRDVGFKRFLYFSIAAIILSSMYDEADLPNPLKQEAFSLPFGNHHVNTVFQHIVNQIPFVGNIRFGGPPVVQMIKLSVDVFGPVRDRKIALRRLQNLGLRLIPGGGQISKSINAHRYFFKVPPQTMADKVRGYMFGPRRWKILNDDMRWLKENAGRLGLTRSKAYQYLNRTSTRSLLAETEKERTEARAKVESYAKRLRAMAESREAELLAREERRKARLAARR